MGKGGSKKGLQSTHHKGKYARQFTKTYRNKEKAWANHLKAHPNDKLATEQIKKAKDTTTKFK